MNSELAIEWQQVSPQVQIEWKIQGDFFNWPCLLVVGIFFVVYFCDVPQISQRGPNTVNTKLKLTVYSQGRPLAQKEPDRAL